MNKRDIGRRIEENAKRAKAYRDLSRRLLIPEEEGLQSEYVRLFGHALSPDCPPYETHYGTRHVFQQTRELADISGFYRAFGVEPSDSGHERADHIAVELEFMGYLAVKEAHALETGRSEEASLCRDAQKKFMEDHLGRWGEDFAARLSQKSSGHYGRLADSLQELIQLECRSLGAAPKKVSHVGFGPPEASEPCFPCGGSCPPTGGQGASSQGSGEAA